MSSISQDKGQQDQSDSMNQNQELDQMNPEMEDEASSQFIVKRTEASDIEYFMGPLLKNEVSSKQTLEYNRFFYLEDIEVGYENSSFSITIIDQRDNSSIVGLFIFNCTPFEPIKREQVPKSLVGSPGLWEEWFQNNFEDTEVNGKNSLWLIYFCLDPNYMRDEDSLKKIFLKIHLSLYTTLSSYSNTLFLISKEQLEQINQSSDVPNQEQSNEGEMSSISTLTTIKIMLNYIYKPVNLLAAPKDQNDFLAYLNKRISVFPIIEIRIGKEFDHDDLENIFKEQTPPETVKQLEDFFIAKIIAKQDEANRVLVGQVIEKAIGMLAISTDININFLIQNFELEPYNNLLDQNYMEAVNLKRKQILAKKEKEQNDEMEQMKKEYEKEIMKCQTISQRIFLQKVLKQQASSFKKIEDLEKDATDKASVMTRKVAEQFIEIFLKDFSILEPQLDKFEGKIQIDEGECLLTTKSDFFLEALEYFGLPHGYMDGVGHWDDWLEKEAKKREQKEQLKKRLGQTSRGSRHTKLKKQEEPVKPKYFDFGPLSKTLRLYVDADIKIRTFIRKTVKEHKDLIASFFVDENGEPSEKRCFDIMSLAKKLTTSNIEVPKTYMDKIGPILLCFGQIPYTKRVVQKMPEVEVVVLNIDQKNKQRKTKNPKKKEVHEEDVKKEVKPINVTVFEVSIKDFFKAIDTTFKYDKLMYELGEIQDNDLKAEVEEYEKKIEHEQYLKSLEIEKSDYQKKREENIKKNEEDSKKNLEKYAKILEDYNDETMTPPTPNEVLNAFCVKLFFIEQAFESRSSDFLLKAFDLFPDKDYLILTQPHSYIENSLLESFIKVDKKVDSLFGEVLYILHRESLMISLLNVSYAEEKDLENSAYLFDQLGHESNYMYQMALKSIRNKNKSKFMVVVCKIKENIICICMLSKEVNIKYYDSHFSIRDYINLDKISKYFHSRIVFFASHKNFSQYNKTFMKEILRLTNKICLYYELSPDVETAPKFFKDFILARNRKFPHFIIKKWDYEKELYEDEKINTRTDGEERDELDEKESDFCLVYLSKKMMVESKIANNNRIVIVGASDTGISFIESLLAIRYLEFSYIYLVAPGGLLYHHIEDEINNLKVSMNNYQIKDLKKLLLEHRIKIINSKVIDIKPKQKYIQFEDYSILNYDYLILTLGLQDHLWIDFRLVCEKSISDKIAELVSSYQTKSTELAIKPNEVSAITEQIYSIQTALKDSIKQMIFTIDDLHLYEKFSVNDKKIISLRKNPKYEILLYGRSLNLYCFIQGLIKRRVPPKKIKLVIPNINFDLVSKFLEKKLQQTKKADKANKDLNDDLLFVNGDNLEDCTEISAFMIQKLRDQGVLVLENYNFSEVIIKKTEWTDVQNIKPELNDLIITSFKFEKDPSKDAKDLKDEDKEGGNTESLTASLIVTGGMLDVDPIVFKFIHENGLVYNGRAIIGNNFLTADPNIFAAGNLCEFSQCYSYREKHKQLKLECYNSQEVGYTLAKYFLQTIDSQLNVDQSAFDDKKLPNFYLPLPTGCYLPGDYIFFKAKSIKETNPNIIKNSDKSSDKNNNDKTLNRQALVYNTLDTDKENGCYLKFNFNVFGIIDTVIYYGKEKIDYKSLICLVGLHETYLNKLLKRFEGNLVTNIPEFLSENWAMALFHDKFSQLVIKLKSILKEEDIKKIVFDVIDNDKQLDREQISDLLDKVSNRTKQKIEFEIVSFLSENKNQLPFYHLPDVKPVEDLPIQNEDGEDYKKNEEDVEQ